MSHLGSLVIDHGVQCTIDRVCVTVSLSLEVVARRSDVRRLLRRVNRDQSGTFTHDVPCLLGPYMLRVYGNVFLGGGDDLSID
jgi:hypothetical protein